MTAESTTPTRREEPGRDEDQATEPWLSEQITFLDLEEGLAG
ncbi:MAG TPA: hypothetical protein VIN34_02985 [Candidatus Limnocylindria bacterium]|jgi:hypothetical protein